MNVKSTARGAALALGSMIIRRPDPDADTQQLADADPERNPDSRAHPIRDGCPVGPR